MLWSRLQLSWKEIKLRLTPMTIKENTDDRLRIIANLQEAQSGEQPTSRGTSFTRNTRSED